MSLVFLNIFFDTLESFITFRKKFSKTPSTDFRFHKPLVSCRFTILSKSSKKSVGEIIYYLPNRRFFVLMNSEFGKLSFISFYALTFLDIKYGPRNSESFDIFSVFLVFLNSLKK